MLTIRQPNLGRGTTATVAAPSPQTYCHGAPMVNAGPDQTVLRLSLAQLAGSVTFDASRCSGTGTFLWSQASGPAATLSNVNTLNPTFTPATNGVYVFQLTARDVDRASADTVSITASSTLPEGNSPLAGLFLSPDGNFYGSTFYGSTFYGSTFYGGTPAAGTFFRMTPSGTVTTLVHFDNDVTGGSPICPPVQSGSDFYQGTDSFGGVVKISSVGTVTVLHRSTIPVSGELYEGGVVGLVVGLDGNLYGGVQYAQSGTGTGIVGEFFRCSTSGAYTSLRMLSEPDDEACKTPFVQVSGGNFYGTELQPSRAIMLTPSGVLTRFATLGGDVISGLMQANDGNFYFVYGTTVRRMNLSGVYTTIADLATISLDPVNPAGASPYMRFIQGADGNLYGTAFIAYGSGSILFKCTLGGALTLLHAFNPSTDGDSTYAGVVQGADGALYGTAFTDGPLGGGTAWKCTTSGTFTLLHSFVTV